MATDPSFQPPEGLAWRAQLFVFALAFVLVVSRRPDALVNPQFYAEDATVWYANAYTFGWLHSSLSPYAGYLQTLPRLAAALALLVPLHLAPLVMNLIGIVVQVLPITLLLSSRCSNWGSPNARVLMALAYIALPNSIELEVAITNAQWHLALMACLLVLASPPTRIRWKILDLATILLSGFTGPFCLVLLPISILFWWMRRQSWRLLVIAAVLVPSIIQAAIVYHFAPMSRPGIGLGATPDLFIRMLAGQVYLGAILGQDNHATTGNLVLLVLVALLGSAVVFYCFIKDGLELRLFLLFVVLIFAASLKSPMMSMTIPQWQVLEKVSGARYWFLPMLAFAWSLIWCLTSSSIRPLRFAAVAVFLAMCLGMAKDWEYPAYGDRHFSQNAKRFEAAPAGTSVDIPIYPDPWLLHLVKK